MKLICHGLLLVLASSLVVAQIQPDPSREDRAATSKAPIIEVDPCSATPPAQVVKGLPLTNWERLQVLDDIAKHANELSRSLQREKTDAAAQAIVDYQDELPKRISDTELKRWATEAMDCVGDLSAVLEGPMPRELRTPTARELRIAMLVYSYVAQEQRRRARWEAVTELSNKHAEKIDAMAKEYNDLLADFKALVERYNRLLGLTQDVSRSLDTERAQHVRDLELLNALSNRPILPARTRPMLPPMPFECLVFNGGGWSKITCQ